MERGFEGEGKRAGQLGNGDSLIDKKSFNSNILQCFGISQFSISKVVYWKDQWKGNIWLLPVP